MQTNLGAEALNTLEHFREYCTEEEFKTLEEGIISLDLSLTSPGCTASIAKKLLKEARDMDFAGFTSLMYANFGKTPSEYLNQAI